MTCGEVKKMIIFNYILPQVHKNHLNWQNIIKITFPEKTFCPVEKVCYICNVASAKP